jgi:hypothetical protein
MKRKAKGCSAELPLWLYGYTALIAVARSRHFDIVVGLWFVFPENYLRGLSTQTKAIADLTRIS